MERSLGLVSVQGATLTIFQFQKIDDFNKYGIAFEVIDQDNDFFIMLLKIQMILEECGKIIICI